MTKTKDRWPDLCKLVADDDRLPVRDAGAWTEDKLYYWNRYVEITTTAMVDKPQWGAGLIYVDLFAGPGICKLRESGRRIPGSVLLAAHAPKPFKRIIACELDQELASACRTRLDLTYAAKRSEVLTGNCNELIDRVTALIPDRALTLAFVDPEALHIHFSTLRRLTTGRRVDLLVLFADRMDIVRNVAFYACQSQSNLDTFLGPDTDWRSKWQNLPNQNARNVCDMFTNIYQEQLRKQLGYEFFSHMPVRSAKGPLYRLIYASKSQRGLDFLRKAESKDKGGQRKLF